MQITNSVVCNASKDCIYKQIKPPFVGEHAFPLTGFVCMAAHITKCNMSQPGKQTPSVEKHAHPLKVTLLAPQTTEFVICISIYICAPHRHITSLSEKSRPKTWPMNYMGKATPVWQLTLSHRCHLKPKTF